MFSMPGEQTRLPKKPITYGRAFKKSPASRARQAELEQTSVAPASSVWDVVDHDDDDAIQRSLSRKTQPKAIRLGGSNIKPSRVEPAKSPPVSPEPRKMATTTFISSAASRGTMQAPRLQQEATHISPEPSDPPVLSMARCVPASPDIESPTLSARPRLDRMRQIGMSSKSARRVPMARSQSDMVFPSPSTSKPAKPLHGVTTLLPSLQIHSQPVTSMNYSSAEMPDLTPAYLPTLVTLPTYQRTPPLKRRRLVDALKAQAEKSSDCSSSEEDGGMGDTQVIRFPGQDRDVTPDVEPISGPTEAESPLSTPKRVKSRDVIRYDSARKVQGSKITYGSMRKVRLEQEAVITDATSEVEAFEKAILKPIAPSYDMDDLSDDEPNGTGPLRSLHDLRQAGANNRFTDELSDLLERAGKPGSPATTARRGALLAMVQKSQTKDFCVQLHDRHGYHGLLEFLGRENDRICGVLLMALAASALTVTSDPVIAAQLQSPDASSFIVRQLKDDDDIIDIGREIGNGLSKVARTALAKVKTQMLGLSILSTAQVATLSPARLTLAAVKLGLECSGASSTAYESVNRNVTDVLIAIIAKSQSSDAHGATFDEIRTDLQLALGILEVLSIPIMQTVEKEHWLRNYVPTVGNLLKDILSTRDTLADETDLLVLKLALNMANNNHEVSIDFARRGITRALAIHLCDSFNSATKCLGDADHFAHALPTVLLMLGGMINICEHDNAAGNSLHVVTDGEASPLDRLIRLYLDHHGGTLEADSLEKGQLNVAVGYLSLLLGYLCLHPNVANRFQFLGGAEKMHPLLESIREFSAIHEAASTASAADEHDESATSTSRKLQELVRRLQDTGRF